jgi:excisionase family DNA binding protein
MQLLTINEAADYLRVKKRTIYNWNSQGKIQSIRLGGLKFDKDHLDGLIRESRKESARGFHN